jgi:hypothetical protein
MDVEVVKEVKEILYQPAAVAAVVEQEILQVHNL